MTHEHENASSDGVQPLGGDPGISELDPLVAGGVTLIVPALVNPQSNGIVVVVDVTLVVVALVVVDEIVVVDEVVDVTVVVVGTIVLVVGPIVEVDVLVVAIDVVLVTGTDVVELSTVDVDVGRIVDVVAGAGDAGAEIVLSGLAPPQSFWAAPGVQFTARAVNGPE